MAHRVRFEFRLKDKDLSRHLKHMRLHAHVVLHLGWELIERGHPAFCRAAGATLQPSVRRSNSCRRACSCATRGSAPQTTPTESSHHKYSGTLWSQSLPGVVSKRTNTRHRRWPAPTSQLSSTTPDPLPARQRRLRLDRALPGNVYHELWMAERSSPTWRMQPCWSNGTDASQRLLSRTRCSGSLVAQTSQGHGAAAPMRITDAEQLRRHQRR